MSFLLLLLGSTLLSGGLAIDEHVFPTSTRSLTSQCTDSATHIFERDNGIEAGCSWLTDDPAQEGIRVAKYCIRPNVMYFCAKTCNTCEKECADNPVYVFRQLILNVFRSCSWITDTPSLIDVKREGYCDTVGLFCPDACGFCPDRGTTNPSLGPSSSPSFTHSSVPSTVPSYHPSISMYPSSMPLSLRSDQPSSSPSAVFSSAPSNDPSYAPSNRISNQPSISMSEAPSVSRNVEISPAPSLSNRPTESIKPSLSTAPSISQSPSISQGPSSFSQRPSPYNAPSKGKDKSKGKGGTKKRSRLL